MNSRLLNSLTTTNWLPAAVGAVLLMLLIRAGGGRALKGENDFVQLYTGGKLAGTPGLYSRTANLRTIQATLGFTMETVVYTRPPFYAALLKPLALFPYRVAYAIFSLATLASILWYVARFSQECPALPFFAAMSIPSIAALCDGQDTPLLLAFVGTSILLARKKRDYSAGLVLSLCAIKFHLFLFVPILLVVQKRWRILGGAAAGTLVLTALGVLVNGFDSLKRYIQVLRDPWINSSPAQMPNLHGLVGMLNGGFAIELTLAGAVLFAFAWTTRRIVNYELLLALSLLCGLLVSFHSGIVDDVLLLPVFVSVATISSGAVLRTLSALILTPAPYFLVLAGAPYSALFPVALLAMVGMFCMQGNAWSLRAGAGTPASIGTPARFSD